MRRMPVMVLWLSALTFAGFGTAFLLEPADIAAAVDLRADTATGRTELRAMYGGLELAFGAFLAACSVGRRHVRIGLVAAFAALAGLATGRAIGIAVEAAATSVTRNLLLLEACAALLVLVALWIDSRGVASGAAGTRTH